MEKKPKTANQSTHRKKEKRLEAERGALNEMVAQRLIEDKPIHNDYDLLKKSQLVDRLLDKMASKTRKKYGMPF